MPCAHVDHAAYDSLGAHWLCCLSELRCILTGVGTSLGAPTRDDGASTVSRDPESTVKTVMARVTVGSNPTPTTYVDGPDQVNRSWGVLIRVVRQSP